MQLLTQYDDDHHLRTGIFALVSLIPPDHESETEQMESSPQHNRIKAVCTFASFIGASLVLGDGAITPAISVLSAVEGIDVALPWTAVYVIPITCGILVALFMIQRFGTHVVGIVFGPIMLVWFFSIGAVGFLNIVASPHCLRAFNPMYGVLFFTRNGATGWVLLGAVVLAVTGVEVKCGCVRACLRDMTPTHHLSCRRCTLTWGTSANGQCGSLGRS